MRAMIDTCVLLDAIQNREPFSKAASEIFLLAANERFTGYLTASSATDIHYIVRRATHSDDLSRQVLQKLFTLFEPLDTTGMDCRRAIPSAVMDYEYAVMVETAVRAQLHCIVTRNGRDYAQSPVPALSPEEFVRRVLAEGEE